VSSSLELFADQETKLSNRDGDVVVKVPKFEKSKLAATGFIKCYFSRDTKFQTQNRKKRTSE